MDANKKFDLVNPQCPNESKILADILNNHPLKLCVAASAQMVPFLRNVLGFSLTLRSPSKFVSKGLSQPIILFSYASNNIDSLPKGMKVISDHYMIEHPDISRRVHDNYHKVENEDINVEKVKEHMVDEEIENLVEGTENDNVKKRVDDVSISNDDMEEESAGDEFELRMREKGKGIEETKDTPPPTP
ncbi:hypothetical protein Tco_1101895, partial [Tanacetum coccineum]